MSTLAPVAPLLAKLLPRLASNHDGEVVATVAAIRRTLEGAGLDLHDLARAIVPQPDIRRIEAAPVDPETAADWFRLADTALDYMDALSDRDITFLRDIGPSLARGRGPSEKQAAWLRGIRSKVEAYARAA